jgi:tRNA(Ile)-lysidine synthetase-like protein
VRDQVLHYIREQKMIRAGDRVAVAVSGGADSVALLRVLLELRAELGIVLAVAHFNHGLRGADSDADEAFVAELARAYELDFFASHGNVRDHASTSKLSLEAAGRELRYRWFAQLAQEQRLDTIATAHTLDDQAETVLLKLLRGAGTKGLAGIWPIRELPRQRDTFEEVGGTGEQQMPRGLKPARDDNQRRGRDDVAPIPPRAHSTRCDRSGPAPAARVGDPGEAAPLQAMACAMARQHPRIVRPLLCISRGEIEAYLTALKQGWREDASNLDRRFLRNRVRHDLLPLLERGYNPKIRRLLADVAETSRAEEEYWRPLVEREIAGRGGGDQFSVAGFGGLPVAFERRLLKRFGELQQIPLDFEHIEKLRRCAVGELKRTELPGGVVVVHSKERLELRSQPCKAGPAYEVVLPIPGEARLIGTGLTVRVTIVPEDLARELPQAELLDRNLIGPELVIRNWRPGDRFWPAHSRSEEKLKRLFAEKHIPEERTNWPVALGRGAIVWVRDFPVAQKYQWRGKTDAVRIQTTSDGW